MSVAGDRSVGGGRSVSGCMSVVDGIPGACGG